MAELEPQQSKVPVRLIENLVGTVFVLCAAKHSVSNSNEQVQVVGPHVAHQIKHLGFVPSPRARGQFDFHHPLYVSHQTSRGGRRFAFQSTVMASNICGKF